MINISQQLIGFISGPSAEIACIEKQQLVQSKLNKILEQQNDYIESAEMILEQYNSAYQDHLTLILRDAGKISAIYVLLLVLFPKFSDTKYSTKQRMWLMVLLPLFIVPSMLSQVCIQNTIPIESTYSILSGLQKDFLTLLYCSGRSLLIGLGIGVGFYMNPWSRFIRSNCTRNESCYNSGNIYVCYTRIDLMRDEIKKEAKQASLIR